MSSILILFLCSCSYTKQDKQHLAAMWVVCAADYYQTNQILEDDKFDEANGMIKDDTDAAFILLGFPLVMTLTMWMIPTEQRKSVFRAVIGVKGAAVLYNYELGVR